MIRTEEEAQGMWCPMTRLIGLQESVAAGTSWNRDPTSENPPHQAYCIGPRCMMWRKHGQIGIGPNGEKRDRDLDGRTRWKDQGYCGLAGKPERS